MEIYTEKQNNHEQENLLNVVCGDVKCDRLHQSL